MREKYENAKISLAKTLEDLGQIPEKMSQPSSRFIIWFMLAQLTDRLDHALGAVTDGANDKGCDAVFIDKDAEKVFVIQAKYSAHFGEPSGSPDAIRSFETLDGHIRTDDGARADNFLRNANQRVRDKLLEARKSVHGQGFELEMLFVTCKRVSAGTKKDFKTHTNKQGVVIDADALVDIIRDWEKGVAPPIRELDLKMDSECVCYEDQRTDEEKVKTWIFQMRGDEMARLADIRGVGPRIFAANVRGDLKKTPVNKAMAKTLKVQPQNFFHRNNGVTISCRGADPIGGGVLRVRRPQIINGQQTARTLAEFARKHLGQQQVAKARVLTRVFVEERGDKLVESVVKGVNDQNPIKASDLMSNNPRQVKLERELRRINIGYLRKRARETKTEAMARLSNSIPGVRRVYKKEEFARAVAGCDMDPVKLPGGGLDSLFRDEYKRLFPKNAGPYYYLSRCSLVEAVTASANKSKRKSDRARAKWVTTGFMWKELTPIVEPKQRQFFEMWMSRGWVEGERMKKALDRAIDMVFVEVLKFYSKETRNMEKRKDIPAFFKDTRDLAEKFDHFWRNNALPTKRRHFGNRLKEIRSALDDWE